MTLIEKMINAMVSHNGEKLEIRSNSKPTLTINEKTQEISQSIISEAQIQSIKNDITTIFGDEHNILFNNTKLLVLSSNFSVIITHENEITEEYIENIDHIPTKDGNKKMDIIEVLHEMITKGSSDLHICAGSKPILRIDGEMTAIEEYAILDSEELWEELKKITPEQNIKEFEENNDTDYAHEIEGLARFRVNVFLDHRGIGAVLRQIPSEIIPAEKLLVPQAIVDLSTLPKGLLLVTGPTGSGKSTTLASLVDHINKTQKKHIITIEDPVEFVHKNKQSLINQREIGKHTDSFKRALKAALREDPDVILVGEMRDLETIAIAIEMAVTGHLVMGTLHTATAVGTIDRIIDQFPVSQQAQIKTMLSEAIVGVAAQMLCKKIGGGRVAAYEIMVVTSGIRNLIREGKTFQIPSIMQTSKGSGNVLMNDNFIRLVSEGLVTPKEAMSKAEEPEVLKGILKAKGLLK